MHLGVQFYSYRTMIMVPRMPKGEQILGMALPHIGVMCEAL